MSFSHTSHRESEFQRESFIRYWDFTYSANQSFVIKSLLLLTDRFICLVQDDTEAGPPGEGTEGGNALAERAKVQTLLQAAQNGNVEAVQV